MEAALFNQERRRLLFARRAVGRDVKNLAWLSCCTRLGLVDRILPERQYTAPHWPALRRLSFLELRHQDQYCDGMQCGSEKCHGPGAARVKRPSRTKIVNRVRLGFVEANDVCIQCHSQGQPLGDRCPKELAKRLAEADGELV
jgi:hypothetical protein